MIHPKAVEAARLILAKNLEASMRISDKDLEAALAISILNNDSVSIIRASHAIVARADKQTTTTEEATPNEPTTPRSFPA